MVNLTPDVAKKFKYLLFDIDDTITTGGKLPAVAYSALWRAHEEGLKVVPITGRPAGWCDMIARQWPVDGVVGENGALAFWEEGGILKHLFHKEAVANDSAELLTIKERVLSEVNHSRLAKDQFSRLFDLAFDFAEEEPRLALKEAQRIKAICEALGAKAKISSIHVNTWMGSYDKLSMTDIFLKHRYDHYAEFDVLFFGDSPNDEPMFTYFTHSVGVANIKDYRDYMENFPRYFTSRRGGEGFAEGVDRLLALRHSKEMICE